MIRPGHVLVTTDAVGGVWTHALDLAAGLAARGVRTTLAVLGPSPSEAQRSQVAGIPAVDLIETGAALDWLADRPAELDAAERSLVELLERTGADLLHLNTPALLSEPLAAPVVGGCHSCLATWWDVVRGGPLPMDFRWRVERLARGYRACDRLIAPSRAFAEATRARYGVLPIVVHNGAAVSDRQAAFKQPFAITSGRLWDDGKNVAVLDRAAGLMKGRVEAAGAVVGPNGKAVALHRLHALGQMTSAALHHRLKTAAAFVSPSLYEPFGLGVLEAAQAGCALVLADIPTFRELWDGAAVFVDPRDEIALAETLDALLEDSNACAQLGEQARIRAERYGGDAMVDGVLAVYGEALAARRPRVEAAA